MEEDAALILDQFAQRRCGCFAAREDRAQIAVESSHLLEDRSRTVRRKRRIEYDAADGAAVFAELAQCFVGVAGGQHHISRAREKATAQPQQLVVVISHEDGCERRAIRHPGSITATMQELCLTGGEQKTKVYR